MSNHYYKKIDEKILFEQSGNTYNISDFASMEVKISPCNKSKTDTILNATTNFLASSVANGNEPVNILIQLKFYDDHKEMIVVNENPVIRFSLDYHKIVKKARTIENSLKAILKS